MYSIKEFKLSSIDAIKQRSSTGWLMKWNLGDYWIKAPGTAFDEPVWDSVAEAIASAIADDLNLKQCLKYKLCIINVDNIRLIGCISKNYKPVDCLEISFKKMMDLSLISENYYNGYRGRQGYERLIREFKDRYNLNIRSYLEDTILIDSIILNTDRNFWNLSTLYNQTLNKIELAPIYDFGNSLGLAAGKWGSFYEDSMYSSGIHANPFDFYFEEQLKYIRSNREYNGELIKTKEIIDFLYKNFTVENNTYNVSDPLSIDNLKYTTGIIKQRYSTIIKEKIWKK